MSTPTPSQMPTLLHAVWGDAGAFESRSEWLVAVYADRAMAERHCELAQAWRTCAERLAFDGEDPPEDLLAKLTEDDKKRLPERDSVLVGDDIHATTTGNPYDTFPQFWDRATYTVHVVMLHHTLEDHVAQVAAGTELAKSNGWIPRG